MEIFFDNLNNRLWIVKTIDKLYVTFLILRQDRIKMLAVDTQTVRMVIFSLPVTI